MARLRRSMMMVPLLTGMSMARMAPFRFLAELIEPKRQKQIFWRPRRRQERKFCTTSMISEAVEASRYT